MPARDSVASLVICAVGEGDGLQPTGKSMPNCFLMPASTSFSASGMPSTPGPLLISMRPSLRAASITACSAAGCCWARQGAVRASRKSDGSSRRHVTKADIIFSPPWPDCLCRTWESRSLLRLHRLLLGDLQLVGPLHGLRRALDDRLRHGVDLVDHRLDLLAADELVFQPLSVRF